MAAGVITVNRDTKPGLLPVMYGMYIVFSNMIKTMFGKELATIQFPEQKRPTSSRYRGIHVLTQREDGTPKCVACYMCATVCPAECIFIEAGARPEQDLAKHPTPLQIRPLRCVHRGIGLDASPGRAIAISRAR